MDVAAFYCTSFFKSLSAVGAFPANHLTVEAQASIGLLLT